MPKYVVRYGVMRALGVFGTRGNDEYERGSQVIARTNRGLEVGNVLCEATEEAVAALRNPTHGQILRGMTSEDQNEFSHMRAGAGDAFEVCARHAEQLGLPMQLVDIEHVFGGERIVVYYLAEGRFDFRELVRRRPDIGVVIYRNLATDISAKLKTTSTSTVVG